MNSAVGPSLDDPEILGGVPLKRQVSKIQTNPLPGPDALGPPTPRGNFQAPLLTRQVSKMEGVTDMAQSTESISVFKNTGRQNESPVNVLMIGTGEYTTGYVNGAASNSDKSAGVVALTMLDLKAKGITGRLGLCGVNGTKFPGIRAHMHNAIGKYKGLDALIDSCETWPKDHEIDPKAYLRAISSFSAGDCAIIFTPDDTHFDIAMACIRQGMHVLVTKPAVKTLAEHQRLHEEAKKYNVLVSIEVHKRWDPIYADARDRIRGLGKFSFLHSYMSQPKHQLETFRAWAGKSSDISYYLNSHHIDFHEWCVGDTARPLKVTATASTGIAQNLFDIKCEDTITLTVEWENLAGEDEMQGDQMQTSRGTAVYTASWIAPKSDVHSQQRFFYMGHKGEVNVDQGHRGYSMSDDGDGFRSVNPLFMKYTPTDGKFSGQNGYGYRSFSVFVEAAKAVNNGDEKVSAYDHSLASIATTYRTTAILEAGRRSLDENRAIFIQYSAADDPCLPTGFA